MEINIFFKNVGQGDSIFLEWQKSEFDEKKFALIDCNIVDGDIVEIIKHIENHGIDSFEFVLMTHPHSDHFSGFERFLQYCSNHDIVIQKFLHTCCYNPDYINEIITTNLDDDEFVKMSLSSVNYDGHKIALKKLFHRLIEHEKNHFNGVLKSLKQLTDESYSLGDGVFLRSLAPSYSEITKYLKSVYYVSNGTGLKMAERCPDNNPAANLLATFIQIYSEIGKWQVFLCSDSTLDVLNRLSDDETFIASLTEDRTLMVQIPHHGSGKNHSEIFWDNISTANDAKALISVGEGYGHPSFEVVSYFDNKFESIHATNFVGGYKEYFKENMGSTKFQQIKEVLDMESIFINNLNKDYSELAQSRCQPIGEKHIVIDANGADVEFKIMPSKEQGIIK